MRLHENIGIYDGGGASLIADRDCPRSNPVVPKSKGRHRHNNSFTYERGEDSLWIIVYRPLFRIEASCRAHRDIRLSVTCGSPVPGVGST